MYIYICIYRFVDLGQGNNNLWLQLTALVVCNTPT